VLQAIISESMHQIKNMIPLVWPQVALSRSKQSHF